MKSGSSVIKCAAIAIGILTSGILAGCQQHTADFPNRAIRLIQPNPAGSASDVTIRRIADKMQASLHESVIVENHPGSSGVTATNLVAKSNPDGYTLVEGTLSTFASNKYMYSDLAYDPVKDFRPIGTITFAPSVFAVSSNLNISTLQQFIAYAEAQPQPLKYGTLGVGSTPHLATVQFLVKTGLKAIQVPYVSASEAFQDLINGQTAFMIYPMSALKPFMDAGTIKVLASTGANRIPSLPQVPTMAEAGVPGYIAGSWSAIFVPAGTPDATVLTLYKAMASAVMGSKGAIESEGNQLFLKTPEETSAFVAAEIERMGPIVQAAGAKVR